MRLLASAILRASKPDLAVDAARCVRGRAGAVCGACAEACPMEAVRLAPGPRIAPGCVGCGACIAVCPVGAFHAERRTDEAIAAEVSAFAREGGSVAFACDRHAAPPSGAVRVPCLARLTPGIVLSAIARGAREVELHRPACESCSLARAAPALRATLETARALLALAGRPPELVREVVAAGAPVILAGPAGATVPFEPAESRRDFLRRFLGWRGGKAATPAEPSGPARNGRRTLLGALDRLAASKAGIFGRPATAPARGALGWLEAKDGCTGCGACVAVCPTRALALERRPDGVTLSLVPRDCTACGACVAVCAPGAIALASPPSLASGLAAAAFRVLEAAGRPCGSCGAPVPHAPPGEVRCAVCARAARRGFRVEPLFGALFAAALGIGALGAFAYAGTDHLHLPGPDSLAAVPEGISEPAEPDSWRLGGFLDLRGVFRFTDNGHDAQSDQDLSQYLSIDGGKGDHFAFEASGRTDEDIDGRRSPRVFPSITDTYGKNVRGYLYTAQADLFDLGPLALLRAGRQYGDSAGPDLHYDGGRVDLRPLGTDKITLSAYGGSPVHLYEASKSGDWLAGAALTLRPFVWTLLRCDYVHVTDERRDRAVTHEDDLVQVSISQRVTEWLKLAARVGTFEGRSTRTQAEALVASDEWDLRGKLRYVYQAGSFRDLSIEFSPLDEVVGRYEPYHEVSISLDKGFGKHFGAGAGFHFRALEHEGDRGPFNHAFRRAYLEGRMRDFPWDGLDVVATGEQYWAEGGDRTTTAAGEIGQRFGEVVEVFGGSSFALYKFDEVFLVERERVRTYYVRAEWKLTKNVRLRASYEAEHDDEESYNAIRVGLRLTW